MRHPLLNLYVIILCIEKQELVPIVFPVALYHDDTIS